VISPEATAKPKRQIGFIDTSILAMLMFAFTALPALFKLQTTDDTQSSPLLKQVLWSLLYFACGIRLVQLTTLREALAKLAPIWIFCSYMLMTALWSVDSNATLVNAIELLGSTVVGCYLATRYSLSRFIGILSWLFLITILLSAVFLVVFRNHGYSFYGSGAWVGFFPEKNRLGAVMSIGILTFAALYSNTQRPRRFLALLGIIVSAVLVIGSNSMTSILVVCAVAVAIGSIAVWCSPRFGVIGKITIIVGIVAAGAAYSSGLTIDTVLGFVGRTPSLSGRDEMWPFVKEAISNRPLLGYGYNAFFRSEIALNFFYSVAAFNNRPPFHAHNSFLQILIAGGYIGLLIFLIGLGIALWKSFLFFIHSKCSAAFFPIATILFLTIGSADETYFPIINSFEWLVYVAAYIYVTRPGGMGSKNRVSDP
jgi:exopolysaccharide production protein ExoQ